MHLVGAPYHWGGVGIVTGDSANELLPLALDNNVHISEYKVATCDIRPGRRPRGPARLELVEDYRRRAGVEDVKLETHAWPASLRRATPSPAWASSPTPRCASAARRARWRARSGTSPDVDPHGLHRQVLRQHASHLGADTLAPRGLHRAAACRRTSTDGASLVQAAARGEAHRRRRRRPTRRATASAG